MTAQLFDFPAPPPKKPAKTRKSFSYSALFEAQVWGPYPRKLNCSKFEAFKAWERLPPECQDYAIAALPIFARSCLGKDESYIPHCATWLNQRRFETVVLVTVVKSTNALDWPAIMKLYAMTSNWKSDLYGPSPGSRGCRVPQKYLGEML